ncbi:MAG TPA: hypothetical protein VHW67_12080 [Solirubrobacteraceae bacterium]|jgi:hypothetical protein|nr:hypothetical protein [Solirubrobacteraceae bacterium]
MGSPFVYEDPLEPPDLLADRTSELALLRDRAAETRNSRLEGPRRYGKTSLLKAALATADKDGLVPIYVNFLGVLTAADVAERVERAYRQQLDGQLKRWFAGVLSTLKPRVRAAPGGVGVEFSPETHTPALLDRLSLPRRLQERHGRQCAIAFDEFQDVVRIGGGIAGAIRSELEQHGKVAAYVFSGSHPGLMRDLFSDRRHAFFAQAKPIDLPRLGTEDLAEYIGSRFESGGRDAGDALELLLRTADGHPQRAMLLAHHLYENTKASGTATSEEWVAAYAAATHDANPEVQAAWDSWNNSERRLMAVISRRVLPLQGRDAQEQYGVSKTGGNQDTLARLEREGHIVADDDSRTRRRVVDPLLEQWLANGRNWPGAAAFPD